jgi:hypothetical protein
MGMGMGTTHDVKSSKTSKNGAATEVFQLMKSRPITEKAVKFFVTMRCLMIWKNENCTPALGPRGGQHLRINSAKSAMICKLDLEQRASGSS